MTEVAPEPEAPDPLIGAVISGCKVLERIGEGGFGTVYKAYDQDLGRPVALKVMLQSLTSSQVFVQKFIREAITAAQLNHPNIVAIHKVGRDEKRGIHYLIMEFIEGKPLQQIVDEEGPLPPERVVPIILQAADALSVAHDKHIVHRDIKPENLMIDRRGTVKIMDFGLAKVVQPDMKSTKVMGTPHYMSPEQFEGKQVDGRTDIYSLGCTFYYALSKSRPYEGTNTVQIIYNILTTDPRSLLDANPAVPEELWTLVSRMIAKKVDDRIPDCREVRKSLLAFQEKALNTLVMCPQCGTRSQRGRKFCPRCGANLLVKCPSCNADEPAGAQVCSHCGAHSEALLAVQQNLERALRLKSVGDFRRSFLLLREVLKLDPGHGRANDELLSVEQSLREIEKGRGEASVLEQAGNVEKAFRGVEELLAKYPASDELQEHRKRLLRRVDARSIEGHFRRADEAQAAGNYQAALVAMEAALRLAPGREDIVARKHELEARIQAQAAEEARRSEPGRKARQAIAAGSYVEALRHLQRGLRDRPGDPELESMAEQCYQGLALQSTEQGSAPPIPSPAPLPPTPDRSAPRPPDPLVGKTFRGFRIESFVAEGGFGSVYKAMDIDLNRPVALKAIRGDVAKDPTLVDRFLKESRIAARIDHPNIVRIHVAGVDDVVGHFLIMEMLHGETLRARLEREGVLPPAEAIGIVVEVARGLHALHAEKVIHRDVKPDNIMLTERRGPVLLDLGIAKELGGARPTTLPIGTSHYMPVEQYAGKGMDDRTDVFALGVTLYHSLSGEYPYRAETSHGLLYAMMDGDGVPLATAMPRVSPALGEVVDRMVAPKPEQRYPSMRAVEKALRALPVWRESRTRPCPMCEAKNPPVARLCVSCGAEMDG